MRVLALLSLVALGCAATPSPTTTYLVERSDVEVRAWWDVRGGAVEPTATESDAADYLWVKAGIADCRAMAGCSVPMLLGIFIRSISLVDTEPPSAIQCGFYASFTAEEIGEHAVPGPRSARHEAAVWKAIAAARAKQATCARIYREVP